MTALAPLLPVFAELIEAALKVLVPIITPIIGILAQLVAAIVSRLVPAVQSIINWLSDWIRKLTSTLNAIGDFAGDAVRFFQDIWNDIQDIPQKIENAFKSSINYVIGLINNLIDGYNSIPVAPDMPRIPMMRASMEMGIMPRMAPLMGAVPAVAARSFATPLRSTASPLARLAQGPLADVSAAANARDMLRSMDVQRSAVESLTARPAPNVTVHAETNADPSEIGREVAWILRTYL
ncbi:hypothetical protein FFZ77_31415 [Streptomyces katsurahamanus]|uniref:Phage tail tape measure protein n=1 Tax=Streptomyces katsurahamanus TaxID=2577098 RepID=A0ABW9P2W1_9ACTN|nr:hypothetical protein [Streptomyces katsurahamanus]